MPDFDRWRTDGCERLRFHYEIKPEDVVLDCGAYRGEWSRKIYNNNKCLIIAFEPIKAYYDITVKALSGTKAVVYNAGIGVANTSCDISVDGDASSILTQSEHREKIEIISIDDVIQKHSLTNIRLIKINIEGAEYDLLDYMLDTAIINRINDIQVQFHDFVENAIERREAIRARLAITHRLTYDYEFVWENWHKS
jgi:FkbM family methyltransferase